MLVVCGPVGEHPTLVYGLAISQVERLTAAAVGEPSRHAAARFLVPMLPEVASDLPGLRNSGLLATEELRTAYRRVMTGQRPQQQASHFCPSLAAVSSRDSGSP